MVPTAPRPLPPHGLFAVLLGSLPAIYQTSVKCLLAYSSISHAGYLLLATLWASAFAWQTRAQLRANQPESATAAFKTLNQACKIGRAHV